MSEPPSTSSGSTATAPAEDDQPFTYVRTKRRSRRTPTTTAYSSSNGDVTGPAGGFAYASSRAATGRRKGKQRADASHEEEDTEKQEQRVVAKAIEVVDVFVRYLGCELGLGREGKREEMGKQEARLTYAQELAATLQGVWPRIVDTEDTEAGADEAVSIADSARPTTENGVEKDKSKAAPPVVPTQIICLGLGSPTTSRSAQVQLALLVVLRSYLQHRSQPRTPSTDPPQPPTCLAYDPIFTLLDTLLLQHYSITVPSPSPSYTANEPTLMYMPHCDRALYDHVLALNPTAPLVLLSNVLANYTSNKEMENQAPTLHKLVDRFEVIELPNWTADRKPLVREGMEGSVSEEMARFRRWWDRNALRDLGFHWISRQRDRV